MKKKFKEIFKSSKNKQLKSNSVLNETNIYEQYDDPQEFKIPSTSNDIKTIERDLESKRYDINILKSFNDVKNIADELKKNKISIVDLSQLSKIEKRRVIDFISGVIYINDGSQKKLEKEIFKLIIRK